MIMWKERKENFLRVKLWTQLKSQESEKGAFYCILLRLFNSTCCGRLQTPKEGKMFFSIVTEKIDILQPISCWHSVHQIVSSVERQGKHLVSVWLLVGKNIIIPVPSAHIFIWNDLHHPYQFITWSISISLS